jgi:hypothetical protein
MAALPPPKHFYKIKNKPTRFRNGEHTYKANNKNSVMAELNEELRPLIRRNEQIIHANDGIYTWIIKGERNRHFYATRVFSEQEIGTLHRDISRRSDDKRDVQCGGELRILPDRTIQFNIQSGTYTRGANEFHLRKDVHLVSEPELYPDLELDAREAYKEIKNPKGYSPEPLSPEDIKTILRKTGDDKSVPIRNIMKRRIILYKRNRMISIVKEMICSFFGKDENCDEVVYLTGGNDNLYLEYDITGKNAEVLAGVSLLSENSLRINPIITENENRNRLNRIFKVNTRKRNHS